jgi:hypothetical protein
VEAGATGAIDRDGRWTSGAGNARCRHKRQPEIAVPVFGYKIGIDREPGFLRRYTITHAAAHDGGQLGAVLDRVNTASDGWADIRGVPLFAVVFSGLAPTS